MTKVLLIGWDAADWNIIRPLLEKDQMPALKRLMDNGVSGNMGTMNPPFSPMLWSSVATGKTPDKHGVLGFMEVTPNMNGIRPVTVTSRKSRAIWNILHHEGLKSNMVGWWPSFPAEPINGVVVSDKFQKVDPNPQKTTPIKIGTIHPEELTHDIKDLRMFPYEVTEAHILPFIPKAAQIDQEKDFGLQSLANLIAQNTSVHAVATYLMRETAWDFMAVYYDMIDHFCHSFMKYYPPKLNGVSQEQYDIYNKTVIGAYRFQDMMLERVMELVDEETTIIVMSDHGFESGAKRILKMPKYPAAPALEHRQFGIFVAAGPNIKKNEKVFGLKLIDIAPTILHMYGLPIGKDMDGNVALDIFENPETPRFIDSWEQVEGDFGEHDSYELEEALSDTETMQQLIDLGYVEKPDEKLEVAILKTQCDLKHNLARVFIGKHDFESAKPLLLELIKHEKPIDVIPYYMDLLSISLSEQDFDVAEKYLGKLRTMNKMFQINTYFSEAKILIGKGKLDQALRLLLAAKERQPNSEVWYQIGIIYRQLQKFDGAKAAFEEAIKMESDSAKYHQALAETLIRTGDFERAAHHALSSINFIKYYPAAHYTLGEALEKLGDLQNAKIAYETASRFVVKKNSRMDMALENVEEKLLNQNEPNDKVSSIYRKNQIVVVSGLPRSGTSLMMQMLHNGGIEVLTDFSRKPDESNPKGYFEYNPVMSIHKDNSWLHLARGKSVKVVAPLLKFLDPQYRYKVIFMNRDLTDVVKSQQKMIGRDTDNLPVDLLNAYRKHLKEVEIWKDKEPGVELLYVNYKDLMEHPEEILPEIISFIGLELDGQTMLGCIDKSLCNW
ncbi:alkaline phosphatase family protein [Mangrovimonas xylaniphaga]|uniref:alkaline phosphatase family protein n=1 Tax=Mangrovimonas xylaniphaga TaxID=1645915 RepID=UPI0006B4B2A2|nr:alkaline phosphatase family protein [Mangrovimonas xylaniphaga]